MKRQSSTIFFSTYCAIKKHVILHHKRCHFIILSHYSFSSVALLAVNLLIKACWDVKGWSRRAEREHRALVFVLPDRVPVSWDEQMVDLAGTWVA